MIQRPERITDTGGTFTGGATTTFTLAVPAKRGVIRRVAFGIYGLVAADTSTLRILVEAPNGDAVLLLSNVGFGTDGGTTAVSGFNLIFDPFAYYDRSLNSVSGRVYKTATADGDEGLQVPDATPVPPYTPDLNFIFDTDTPEGTWKLYIYDSGSGGSFDYWGIDFEYDSGEPYDTPMSDFYATNFTKVNVNYGFTADVYPLEIEASGMNGRVDYMDVSFTLQHSDPSALTFILEAPNGAASMFVSGTSLQNPGLVVVNFVDKTFAPSPFMSIGDGDYIQNTNYNPTEGNFITTAGFGIAPQPGPDGYYEHRLYPTLFGDPNGTWKLWVEDHGGGSGSFLNFQMHFYAEDINRTGSGGVLAAGKSPSSKRGIEMFYDLTGTPYDGSVGPFGNDMSEVVDNTVEKSDWVDLKFTIDATGGDGSGPLYIFLLRSLDGVTFDTADMDACLLRKVNLTGSGAFTISVNLRESFGKVSRYWRLYFVNQSPHNANITASFGNQYIFVQNRG
jgi:subtilisin-like proprotein convertase family protein